MGVDLSSVKVVTCPSGWKSSKIGQLYKFKNGLNKAKEFFGHGTPIVNYMDVYRNVHVSAHSLNGLVDVTKEELLNYGVKSCDLLFTRTSETVEEIGLSSTVIGNFENTVFSGFLLRGRPTDSSIDPIFAGYLFRSQAVRKSIQTTASYTTRALTNGRLLSEIEINYPPKIEQIKIAKVLADLDKQIDWISNLIEKKRAIKQAAMQQLLSGKTRLPGFSGKWVERTLGSLADIQRGASPRPIDNPLWFSENSIIGWVRISDVTSSTKFLNISEQKLSVLGVKASRFVKAHSLIMSICATVGRPIITKIDVCIHDGFVVFREPKVDLEYLYYFLSDIEKNWVKMGQTGSQMNLNTNLIKTTLIKFPEDKLEQSAISQFLDSMDLDLNASQCKLEKLRLIKQGMMQELLTGRIRLL